MKTIQLALVTLALSFSFGLVACDKATEEAAPATEEAAPAAADAPEAPKPE